MRVFVSFALPLSFLLSLAACGDMMGDGPGREEGGMNGGGERHHHHGGGCPGMGEADATTATEDAATATATDDAATATATDDAAVAPECAASAECAVGSQCVGGACVACEGDCGCARDEECPADQICDHSRGVCGAVGVACGELHDEGACVARADCRPIYGGVDCTDAQGGACTSGDEACTCATFSFVLCAPAQ